MYVTFVFCFEQRGFRYNMATEIEHYVRPSSQQKEIMTGYVVSFLSRTNSILYLWPYYSELRVVRSRIFIIGTETRQTARRPSQLSYRPAYLQQALG